MPEPLFYQRVPTNGLETSATFWHWGLRRVGCCHSFRLCRTGCRGSKRPGGPPLPWDGRAFRPTTPPSPAGGLMPRSRNIHHGDRRRCDPHDRYRRATPRESICCLKDCTKMIKTPIDIKDCSVRARAIFVQSLCNLYRGRRYNLFVPRYRASSTSAPGPGEVPMVRVFGTGRNRLAPTSDPRQPSRQSGRGTGAR